MKKSKNGLNTEKSKRSKDNISQKELSYFKKLIKGHEKLLEAIGKL